MGILCYIITLYTCGNIFSIDGKTNDYWTTGSLTVIIQCLIYHFMVFIETRNITWFILLFFIVSLIALPLNIQMNDSLSTSVYYKSQWSIIFTSPLFYLSAFVQIIIVILPRMIYLAFEHIVWHPEFTKIRGF